MGLISKSKLAEIKKIQREEKSRKKRKVKVRHEKVSFLIVCEGKCTEPNYFNSFIDNRNSKVIESKIIGKGYNTVSLIKETIKIVKKSFKEYDRIWAVFDKDDFENFNDAIKLAKKNNIYCAWSNESFELWYYLYFQYLDTGISRQEYIKKIEREIQSKTGNSSFKYKKNDKDFYAILQKYGNEEQAIINAEKLQNLYHDKDYASHKPCTHVSNLVKELKNPSSLLE
ncbi:MAG: RloB family protein [Bacteroidales bacterium]